MSVEDEDPVESIDEQAADWIVRQDGDGLTGAERTAFAEWLASPDHRAAYDRYRAVWGEYARAGAATLPTVVPRPRRPRPRRQASMRTAKRPFVAAAVAASLALAIVGHVDGWPTRLRADHATGIGERRTLVLKDGSTVQLDARSAITFAQVDGRRSLRLLTGAAAIQVAPDRAHPFAVETSAGRITALGTSFVLRDEGNAVALTVTEHSVAVRAQDGREAIVREGEATRFDADRIAPPHKADIDAATAWTRGKLFVVDRPLGEVVALIGQRRLGYWTVRDDAAAIRVSGVYDLDNPLAALGVLEQTLGLKSIRLSNRVIILGR